MIKKFGKLYKVMSESKNKKGEHKNLGESNTLEGAKKRLRQVEYFKHLKKK